MTRGVESIALNHMIRADLPEEVTFDHRSEEGQFMQRSERELRQRQK